MELLGAGVFAAACVVSVNNGLDAQYRLRHVTQAADVVAGLEDFLRTAAALGVLAAHMSTPYGGAIKRGVPYCAALLACAGSGLLADPSLLLVESSGALDLALGGNTAEALGATVMTSFGETFVKVFYAAKWALAAAAAAELLRMLPRVARGIARAPARIRAAALSRGSALALGALNAACAFEHVVRPTVLDPEARRRARQIESLGLRGALSGNATLAGLYDQLSEAAFSSGFMRVADEYLGAALLALLTALALAAACMESRAEPLAPLALLTASNLVALEATTDAEGLYTALLLSAGALLLAAGLAALPRLRLDGALEGLPPLLYRAGLLAMLLAAPLMLLAYSHPWAAFHAEPVGITSRAITALADAEFKIDGIIDGIVDTVAKVNPCVQPFAVDPDADRAPAAVRRDVRDDMAEARHGMAQTCLVQDCTKCLDAEDNWIDPGGLNWFTNRCEQLQAKEAEMVEEASAEANADVEEASANRDLSGVTRDSKYEYNKRCENLKCIVFTSLATVLLVLAKIPYVGTYASVLKDVATVTYKFFRFGIRLFKRLRRFAKRAGKMTRARKFLKKLKAAAASRAISPATARGMLWLFLPVIVSAAVALTLITVRRAAGDKAFAARALLALKIGVGLALPLAAAELATLGVLMGYPAVLGSLLGALPEEFVTASVQTDAGLRAAQTAYAISAAGNLAVLASAVLHVNAGALQSLLRGARIMPAGARAPLHDTLHAAYTYRALAPRLATSARRRALLNVQFLQPALFGALVPLLVHLGRGEDYVSFQYGLKSDVARTAAEVKELNQAAVDAADVDDEFAEMNCGPIGVVAENLLSFVVSIRSRLVEPFRAATDKLAAELDGLDDKLDALLEKTRVDIPDILPNASINVAVFAVPLLIAILFAAAWVIGVLGAKVALVGPLRRAFGADRVSLEEFMVPVVAGAAVLTFTMIITHVVVGNMLETLSGSDITYFELRATLGWKHYYALGAHCANLLSIVAYYVNLQIPVE